MGESERAKALLWLNSRLGREIDVGMTIPLGECDLDVLSVAGRLSLGEASGPAGHYRVGEASLDLEDVCPREVLMGLHADPFDLVVRLAEGTALQIVEVEGTEGRSGEVQATAP